MKNRVQFKTRPELLKDTGIDDEYLFRDLAMRMVKEMPIDELHKLMEFSKTDPNSEHSKRVLWDEDYPDWQKRQVYQLRNEDVILYEAECDLP